MRCFSGSVISCLTKATYAVKSCSAAAQRHTNSFRMANVFEIILNQPVTSHLPVRGSQHSLSWSISWPGRRASLLWRSRPECRLPAPPESSPSPGGPNKQRGAATNSLEDKRCQTEATITVSLRTFILTCVAQIFNEKNSCSVFKSMLSIYIWEYEGAGQQAGQQSQKIKS